MNVYSHKNLNVKRLLTLGDLDIRGIAARDESLAADDYFARVEQFIEDAPQYCDVFANISKLDENIRILKELEKKLGVSERPLKLSEDTEKLDSLGNIKNVLAGIGLNKLDADIDNICMAIRSDNIQMAEKQAGEAFDKLNSLVGRIKSAQLIKKFTLGGDEKDGGEASESGISLAKALQYLDYEEENRKLRVLAVDDVSVVLNTITSVLSPYYEVFALKNSAQVAKFLMNTTPELFLLDIEMNEMSGFDLIPIIRQFEEHKDTPIIFLTGNASMNNLKGAIALGVCDFITKPVSREVLLEKIEKNIVRKKLY